MNYKELLKDKNAQVEERFALAAERICQIASGEPSDMKESFQTYFITLAEFLVKCQTLYQKIKEGEMEEISLEDWKQENQSFYQDILPEYYERSYANPTFAVKSLGENLGKLLCFLYTELRAERVFAFEQDLTKITILHELFLEVYGMFASEEVTYKQLRETIYWFLYDYADEWCGWRIREMLDPTLCFATDIVRKSDLKDVRYLYHYGEYISENEIQMAEYLASFSEEEIEEIARTFTEGFRKGFLMKGVDLSTKETVNIRYSIGYERVIRAAIRQFADMGLESILYRSASNTLNKRQNHRIGYVSTSPNQQFEHDHRFDCALYLDKRMVDRKIDCMRKAYEEYAEEAMGFAGPAFMDVFGMDAFSPMHKEEACQLSERQQNLMVEYSSLSNALMNEFINQEERSFTMIAYPIPAIGPSFPDIFHEMIKVNQLDSGKYEEIQQKMIEVLDQANAVQIMGGGENMTNLLVSLQEVDDLEKQTKFENCLADVNIPLGEVFTTPKLKGTTGLLHVTKVFLEGCFYKNLKIYFEDGMIKDYSCDNFDSAELGRAWIKENILYNRETLPMGEFAIGTNTLAYVMAKRYGIMDKLPILIAEKMGPHMAVGDSCYCYSEDVKVYNPDGREVMPKENDFSLLRKESPMKAYFNCHTDITIPYEEISCISALMPDHYEVPIIINGRFVLDGTMELNEAFDPEQEPESVESHIMEEMKKAIQI